MSDVGAVRLFAGDYLCPGVPAPRKAFSSSLPVALRGTEVIWVPDRGTGWGPGIAPKSPLGMATSARWKIMWRECFATFAGIFASFARSVVSEQR